MGIKKGSVLSLPLNVLTEEQITDEYRSNASHRIGQQAARNGMTGFRDTYTTEVYRQNIEGGIGRTLENTG